MQFDFQRALEGQREGKAIPAHPALMSRDPITTYSPGASNPREDAKISQAEATRHLDAYGGVQAIDWLSDCLNLYSDTASTAKWYLEKDGKRLVRKKSDGDLPGSEEAPKDLLNLLDNPNPFMDYMELVELLVFDLMLVGNGYWYKWRTTSDGKPLALYRLAPPYVKIIPGPFGPKRYEYQPPNASKPLRIDPKDIIHFRRPNPHSQYYGLGIVQSGGRPYDLELALTDTMAAYYENRADPSLIVQSERRVPRDVFNKLRAQLRQRIGGSRNAGELLVLEAGLKATSISASARDALFEQLTKMSRDRIFAMFRASPMLFGMMDESGTNKVSDARREFDTKVMRPFLDKLQARITAGLVAAWGCEFKIDYNYVMAPEDLLKVVGDVAVLPGIKVREIRRFLTAVGISESTGDAKIDEMVLNLPGENLGPDGQPVKGGAGFADRPIGSEPGRPPLGQNTRAFPPGTAARSPQGKALTINDAIERLQAIADAKALTQDHRTTVGNKLPDEQRPQDRLAAERTRDVNAAVNYIYSNLGDAAHVLERGLLDHVEGKAFKPNDLKQRLKRSESWKTFMSMVAGVLEQGAVRAISAAALHQTSQGRTPDNEIDYEQIARRVVYRKDGVDAISKNLRNEIVQNVGVALADGKERGDVEQIIRQSIDFWRSSQAETIALTEAVHAYNEGTLSIAEELGVLEVVVEDGTDHDEPCKEADGAVWTIEHAREHRLEHPRCRRAFTPLV